LRDAVGRKIDFASGARQTMERGVYSVLVNAGKPDDSGPFTLTSAFTPEPRTLCRDFPALGLKQSAAGPLSPARCQLLAGTPFEGYSIRTFGAGVLDVSFDSDSGLAVILRPDDGRALEPDSMGPSRATYSVSADETYTLIVSGTGNYRVTTAFQPSPGETC